MRRLPTPMRKANPPDLEPPPEALTKGRRPGHARGGEAGRASAEPAGGPGVAEHLGGREQGGSLPGMQQVPDRRLRARRTRSAPLQRHTEYPDLQPRSPAHPARVKPLTLLLFLPPPSIPACRGGPAAPARGRARPP